MLRGVNKRIIEINDTGSDYFEKVYFIVNENKYLNLDELEREARRITADYFGIEPKVNEDSGRNCSTAMSTYNGKIENKHTGYLRYTDMKRKRAETFVFVSLIAIAVITALVMILL